MGWGSRAWDCVLHLKPETPRSLRRELYWDKVSACLFWRVTYAASGCTGCIIQLLAVCTIVLLTSIVSQAVWASCVLFTTKGEEDDGDKEENNSGWNMAELSSTLCRFQPVASRHGKLKRKVWLGGFNSTFFVTTTNYNGWANSCFNHSHQWCTNSANSVVFVIQFTGN